MQDFIQELRHTLRTLLAGAERRARWWGWWGTHVLRREDGGRADPWMFGMLALLVMAGTLLASWLPVRRATRVDPLVALRGE
jgi:hypothetical protein